MQSDLEDGSTGINYNLFDDIKSGASDKSIGKNNSTIRKTNVAALDNGGGGDNHSDALLLKWCTVYQAFEVLLAAGFIVLLVIIIIQGANIYHIVEDTYGPEPGNGSLLCNLIGDSLFNKPFNMFDLPHKINYFVNNQLTIQNYATNGQVIAGIANSLPPAIYDPTPDIVLLLWDSDVSNYDEYLMTQQQIHDVRENYVQNLSYVINTTLRAGVKYMAVGGPGFLGEWYLLKKHYFWHKVDMLNEYRTLNEEVTAYWNVTYINVRHKYIESLPWYWPYFQWYITIDGEHENGRGTRFVSKLYGEAIANWLRVYNSSYLER